MEAEVFESMSEASRGEWSVEESEKRLKLFADRVTQRGLGDPKSLKLKNSRLALETFLGLNLFILNIKKASVNDSCLHVRLTSFHYSSRLVIQRQYGKF